MSMTEEKSDDWSSPTLKEVPFWREGMSQEEYEVEREYYAQNFHLVKEGSYVPLWRLRQQGK